VDDQDRLDPVVAVGAQGSIGSIDFRASEWGVDCAITGSQKGLMLPAGLGIVCVSPREQRQRRRVGEVAGGIGLGLVREVEVAAPALGGLGSSIGSIDFRASEWGVDCAITGSQKGLMLPAGLGIVGEVAGGIGLGLVREVEVAAPALGGLGGGQRPRADGLRESMRCLFEEGLEQVFARHRFLADGTRAAVKACCSGDRRCRSPRRR
jgi:hypothetical protein